ncbi:MAG: inositol monophosphatase [Deltaproteobacteria bacterium]|nr:inositol monophosphatase [Deltaproteobacteria bacterium]
MTAPTPSDLKHYLAFASETGRAAGQLIREKLREQKTFRSKSAETDLVTETDLAAERLIVAAIGKSFPGHSILGEEGTGDRHSGAGYQSGYCWVIDPIDGTTNFAHGHPIVGCSIGLTWNGEPVAGCVNCPGLNEEFLAAKGLGATLNGEPIRVSGVPTLSRSLLATGLPYDRRERADHYLARWKKFLMVSHEIRRLGSASIDLCWVAAGRVDGYWEENLKPWDIAAGIIIVREAGGMVTGFAGEPHDLNGRETLATNGLIHSEMSALLKG